MDLPTYTNIWRIEKRLYRLYDMKLPVPVGMRTFGVGVGILIGWLCLLAILGVPFVFGDGWLLVLYVVPPGVLTVACVRPIHEGKRLPELVWSYTKFAYQGRVYVRGARYRAPGMIRFRAQVWTLPGTLPEPIAHHGPGPAPLTAPRSTPRRAPAPPATRPLPTRRPPTPQRPLPQSTPAPVTAPVPDSPQPSPPAPAHAPAQEHPQNQSAPATPPEPVTTPSTTPDPAALLIMVMGCAEHSGQTSTAHALAHSLPPGSGPAAVVTFTTDYPGHLALTSTTNDPTPDSDSTTSGPVTFTLVLDEDARGRDVAAHLAPILHRYPVVILDPPSTTLTPLLSLVDQLVVCATNTHAGAREMLLCSEWLRSAGHESLAEQALAVLIPTTSHRSDPMLSAASTGVRQVYTPTWDAQVRAHRRPTTSAATYTDLADQALHVPAHP